MLIQTCAVLKAETSATEAERQRLPNEELGRIDPSGRSRKEKSE